MANYSLEGGADLANIEQQVVKMMAQEIVRAIKKMNEDNNKNYVDNQLKNYKGLEKVIVSGGGGNIGGSIDASQVTGLYGAVAGYIANSPDYALAGDLDAGRIITTISGIAAIEVESATIDTAQIENLYASYGEFINLVAKNAEIENLDVEQVRADIATMGLANIDSAKISWAQIEGLVADTALIRQGVGGKLYIDDLAVTEAQILTLFTGELVLQGTNGKLYTVYLDEEGKLKTKERSITGSDIADGSIEGSNIASGSIVGTNIAENTITGALITEHGITARELNVSQIFADEALINAIKAANIDVDDLFANTAFINSLTTSIIKSPTVGNELDISGNSSIVLTDKKLGLIVSSESSESELVLTDQMLDIIANKVRVYADNIDFSANESITAIVQKEIAEISNNVFVGNEPASPVADMIWLDTNVSPNLFKVWDGEKWNVVNDVTSIASRIDSAELKINSLDASITSTSKSVDNLNGRVNIAEEKIKPNSIVQTVRSNDAYKADIAQATMTSDKFESFIANSSGISSISQTANKVNLIVKSGSTETNVQLTDKAIETISEKVQINAEQVEINVGGTTQKLSENGIISIVTSSNEFSEVKQDANKIDLVVADGSTSSQVKITEKAIEAISNDITVNGKKLTVIAGEVTQAQQDADFATPIDSTEPPATAPAAGKLWIDRGTTPPIFRRWKGQDVSTDRDWGEAFALTSHASPNAYYDNTAGLLESIDSVVTTFTPGQDGSGTPGPGNIRELRGYTYSALWQNSYGQTDSVNQKSRIEFGETIYGAEIDWLNGIWKQTHWEYVLTGEESISVMTHNGAARFTIRIPDSKYRPAASRVPYCTHFYGTAAPYGANNVDYAICVDVNLIYLTASGLLGEVVNARNYLKNQAAAGKPVRVVVKLKEPIVHTFTPAAVDVFESMLFLHVSPDTVVAPRTLAVNGTFSGWETLNSAEDIRAAQAQIQLNQQNAQAAIDELRTAVVTDNEGVHVRKVDNDDVQLIQNEVLITQKDVNIVSGGVRNSSFGSGYVRLLGMVIRVASNGIVIEAAEV